MATSVVTPSQKQAALGRLARSDVVGLSHGASRIGYAAIEELAVKRLVERGLCNATVADMHYGMILKLLQEARLTITMKAPNWFYAENKYSSYTNFWERGVSGASNDANRRDDVENKLFGYDDANHGPDRRLWEHGVRGQRSFQPAMRPRYAALDFGACRNGGLTKYGKSFLVLKEHLKHNATFTHCDSFEVVQDMASRARDEYGGHVYGLGDVRCSFHQMGKLVYFCNPAMLAKMHAYGTGRQAPGSENCLLGGLAYLEAQVHADIEFSRDVQALHISDGECQAGVIPHPKAGRNFIVRKTVWDGADATQVKNNAKKFARKHKLELVAAP